MKRTGRLLVWTFAAAAAVGAVSPVAGQNRQAAGQHAAAQAEQRKGFSIFRFFRPREPRRVIILEAPPEQGARGSQRARKAQTQRQRARTQQATPQKRRSRDTSTARRAAPVPPPVVVEKSPNAERVLVVGDFMAGAMAKGLMDIYSENPNVVVEEASNGSSGLVRADHYNWPEELKGVVAEHNPAAIVVMIGLNDRQTISTETGAHVMGTEGWAEAYAGRISAFAEALKATGKPVFWASLVPVRSSAMSRDYSALNGTLRDTLDGTGITFVDLWNGFADEDGRFITSGPDVSGQNAQLRASDGINFTKPGQRKLAFFVQQLLDGVLKGGTPAAVAAVAPDAEVAGPPAPEGPKIGPMVPMGAIMPAASDLSSAPAPAKAGEAATIVVQRLNGADRKAPPLRADNYQAWPAE